MSAANIQVNSSVRHEIQPSATDKATYIRDALVEMRRIAEDDELGFLRYLLSMALEEANVSVVMTAKHPAK